ncbi:hypothetical protein V9Y23_18240, partial [Klebsiella pneumoniae]
NTYDLFVGKTLLHGDVLMWLMKTLLTSRCINQRGAGQDNSFAISENIFTENYQDLTKKSITLNNIHTAKREKNIIESKIHNKKALNKTKKRL